MNKCEKCIHIHVCRNLAKWTPESKNCSDYCEMPKKGEWIPISSGKLPKEKINPYTTDFDEVLCTTDWGEVKALKFGTPILHHEPHFWLGGAKMDEHIIAWQYKPEPYKETDNDLLLR